MADTDSLKDDSPAARSPKDSGDLQPESGVVAEESTENPGSATQNVENEPKPAAATEPSSEPSMVEEENAETGLVDHVIRWGPLILIGFLILVMSD